MGCDSEALLQYACEKFALKQYEDALEAFVLAYSKGFEKKWVLENIYNCYVNGNEKEFRDVFECSNYNKNFSYEDCLLDFVPYKEGQYYIFDKEQQRFCGVFSVHEMENTPIEKILEKKEFSAVVTENEWSVNEIASILAERTQRKIYVICKDIKRMISFWKIPELMEKLQRVYIFRSEEEFQQYFHKHTAEYLPKIIFGSQEFEQRLGEIILKEHRYRLTPDGRNTSNVLLTIGIPTYNRGNLLVERVKHLLEMKYDAEIEFSISKNGMEFYQSEYELVEQLSDARIKYFDHKKTLRIQQNWHYVVEQATGKYVLFVSDEDDVELEAVEHYFKLLSNYSDISVLRAKTRYQYGDMNERIYEKKGVGAFSEVFLKQNYLSGLIVRRNDFLKEQFLELERYSDNLYYELYPHDWWSAILSQSGDYLEEPIELIRENEPVLQEEAHKYKEKGIKQESAIILENSGLPGYATYEQRLKQFRGYIDFLHIFGEENIAIIQVGMNRAIRKVTAMMEIARRYNYDCEHYLTFVDQFIYMAMDCLDEFLLDETTQVELLETIKSCGTKLINYDEKISEENFGDIQVHKHTEHNLLFINGQSQYGALRRLITDAAEAFRKIGYNVLIIDATEENYAEQFYNAKECYKFDAVFSYNMIGAGIDAIQHMGEKYVTIMCDHPIWHSERLPYADQDTIIWYGDQYDLDYVKQYYPNVGRNEFVVCPTDCFGEEISYFDRVYDLVFIGSYDKPEKWEKIICSLYSGHMLKLIKAFMNRLIERPYLTYEEGLRQIFEEFSVNIVDDQQFIDIAQELCYVNKYIRSYYRDKIIRTIVDYGITIHVSGNGWENFESEYKDKLIIENNDWYTAKKMLENAKISLNIMPWFKAGTHDRAISSMLEGTVLLTDSSEFFEKNYTDMEDVVIFSLDKLQELPEKINYLLSHPQTAEKIAQNGKKNTETNFNWENAAKFMALVLQEETKDDTKLQGEGEYLSIEQSGARRPAVARNVLKELKDIEQVLNSFKKGTTSKLIALKDYQYIISEIEKVMQLFVFEFPDIEVEFNDWKLGKKVTDISLDELYEEIELQIKYLEKVILSECIEK